MNPGDFAVWMRGVIDALGDEPPSAERWARIVEQVKKIGAAPVAPLKLSDYVPPAYPPVINPTMPWPSGPIYVGDPIPQPQWPPNTIICSH